MARRLATVGYYVLLPNLYYRSNVAELGPFIGDAGAAVREKMMGLMAGLLGTAFGTILAYAVGIGCLYLADFSSKH